MKIKQRPEDFVVREGYRFESEAEGPVWVYRMDKQKVSTLLREGFGWKNVIDLGDITGARATEQWLPLWLRLYGNLQTPNFNLKIVRG